MQTLEQPQAATEQQFHDQIVRIRKLFQDGVDLLAGENHRDIERLLRPRHVAQFAEFPFQAMAVEKQQRIERLVLGRGGDLALHRQKGQILLHIGGCQLLRRFVLQETLELAGPLGIGFQGLAGIMPHLDLGRQCFKHRVPFRRIGLFLVSGFVIFGTSCLEIVVY